MIKPRKWLDALTDLNAKGKERASTCQSCDKRNGGICSECGCFLSVKVMIPTATCPLNKW